MVALSPMTWVMVNIVVRPDGTWSFVENLSSIIDVENREEIKNDVERVDLTAALQHIKSVIKPDLALIHFVCYKGTTIYRSEIYILYFFILLSKYLMRVHFTTTLPQN